MRKVGDKVRLIAIPDSVSSDPEDDTRRVLQKMLESNRPRKVHKVDPSGGVQLQAYENEKNGRVYHFILVEPECVVLI